MKTTEPIQAGQAAKKVLQKLRKRMNKRSGKALAGREPPTLPDQSQPKTATPSCETMNLKNNCALMVW